MIKEKIGSSAGLALNVAFNAVRISPNTPDAVTSTVTTPTAVAVAPDVGSLDRARMDLMKSPPLGPNSLTEFITDRGASGILPERQAGDSNDDKEYGRKGRGGIEGDGSSRLKASLATKPDTAAFKTRHKSPIALLASLECATSCALRR